VLVGVCVSAWSRRRDVRAVVATQPQRLLALFLPISTASHAVTDIFRPRHIRPRIWRGAVVLRLAGVTLMSFAWWGGGGGGGRARSRKGVSTATSASVSVGGVSRRRAGAHMLSLVCLRARANSENELRSSSIGEPITAVRRGRPDKRRRPSLETSLLAAPLSALLCGGGRLRTHVTRPHRVSPTPAQVPPDTVPQTRPRGPCHPKQGADGWVAWGTGAVQTAGAGR